MSLLTTTQQTQIVKRKHSDTHYARYPRSPLSNCCSGENFKAYGTDISSAVRPKRILNQNHTQESQQVTALLGIKGLDRIFE